MAFLMSMQAASDRVIHEDVKVKPKATTDRRKLEISGRWDVCHWKPQASQAKKSAYLGCVCQGHRGRVPHAFGNPHMFTVYHR